MNLVLSSFKSEIDRAKMTIKGETKND